VSVGSSPQKRARWEGSDIEDVDEGPALSGSSGEGGWGTRGLWERNFRKLNRLSLCETGCDDAQLRTKLNLKNASCADSISGQSFGGRTYRLRARELLSSCAREDGSPECIISRATLHWDVGFTTNCRFRMCVCTLGYIMNIYRKDLLSARRSKWDAA